MASDTKALDQAVRNAALTTTVTATMLRCSLADGPQIAAVADRIRAEYHRILATRNTFDGCTFRQTGETTKW